MGSFDFWRKWLLAVSVYLVIFGLFLAFFNQSYLMDLLFNNQIDPVFQIGQSGSEETARFQAWIYGVLGATVSGWGILMTYIVYYPFASRNGWAWNAIALGIGVWFVVDTSISIFHGVVFNAVFNTLLFILVAAPLVFTKRHFKR
jgi:hypothetical protein